MSGDADDDAVFGPAVPLHRPDLGGWVLTYTYGGRLCFVEDYRRPQTRYLRFSTQEEAQAYADAWNAADAPPDG